MLVSAAALVGLLASLRPASPPPPEGIPVQAAVMPAFRADSGALWNDPSIDPAVLEKAFAPPPADLPPEALPFASNITPDPQSLKALEGSGDLAAY